MSLNRIKLLLRCISFDNWHTREQRKTDEKFAAVSKIWESFLRNARCIYIPGKCITVNEKLVRYRGKIPGRTYIPSKPRKYDLKIFWACESNTGHGLNAIAYGGKEGSLCSSQFGPGYCAKSCRALVRYWKRHLH